MKKLFSAAAAVVCVLAMVLTFSGCDASYEFDGNTGSTYTRYTFRDVGGITTHSGNGYVTAPTGGNQTGTQRTERLPNLASTYHNNLFLKSRANGGCDRLVGNIKVTVVFVDDATKTWNQTDIAARKQALQQGTQFLTEQARKYGQTVSFSFEYKTARTNQSVSMKDSGDWAKSVGASAGLPDFSALNNTLETKYGVNEAPVLFCINHTGRSFAQSDWTAEYAVLYNDGNPTAHEMLHIFGAKDYYMPEEVQKASVDIFGECIMKDSNSKTVDSLTAYLVGWTDTPDAKAMQFLQKTNHITQAMMDAAYEHNTTTGYVTNWKTNDGNFFTGNLLEGNFADGQGTLVYANGDKYVGNFTNGYFHGQGTLTWASGNKYVGAWQNGERTGYGTLTYKDGGKYVGAFVNGEFNGQGTYTWPNGDTYVGAWQNSKRNGQGTLTFKSGGKYVGAFVNDAFNGQGTYTWPNGDKFVGAWKNGQRNGYGTYTWANGSTQSGQWVDGTFTE